MAKRFTDTDKWKRQWFTDLEYKAKLVWFYVLDQCDHRGVWFANFKLMSSQVGFKVDRAQFEKWFGSKVRAFDDDKYFVPSFVDFQFGKLNPANNAHKGVLELLAILGPEEGPSQPLISPCEGAQDKDKEKEKEEEGECEGKQNSFDFEAVYAIYPRKEGRAIGLRKLKAMIRTQAEFETLMNGTRRFEYLSRKKEPKYIPLFSTFVEQQRWLDSVPSAAVSPPRNEVAQTSGAFSEEPATSQPITRASSLPAEAQRALAILSGKRVEPEGA